jgi:hypothetical protein
MPLDINKLMKKAADDLAQKKPELFDNKPVDKTIDYKKSKEQFKKLQTEITALKKSKNRSRNK